VADPKDILLFAKPSCPLSHEVPAEVDSSYWSMSSQSSSSADHTMSYFELRYLEHPKVTPGNGRYEE